VANAYEVDIVDIMGVGREIPLPEARKMNYYIHYRCGYHLTAIAEKYGTSRDSIYRALSDIPDYMRIYKEVKQKHNQIINTILNKINHEIETNANQIKRHA